MRALDLKLFRDLTRLSGQVVTISLVVAAGIAAWVCLRSAYQSLLISRDRYYSQERFGDVFARAERVPNSIARRIESLPGVATVYPRLHEFAMLPVDFLDEPARAEVVSLPRDGEPPANGIVLLEGRYPDPERDDEALLLESFARQHRVEVGETLPAVMEGTKRELRVVGVAMSPEFVFATTEGAIAAEQRFAALWMPIDAVAAAYRKEGAFSEVVIRLQRGASAQGVIADLDRLLGPYGSAGAFGRDQQPSNYILSSELTQLRGMATVAPIIFLSVAAFLVNVVLARLVQLQRGQIATLKAVGYREWEIGLHYIELVTVMVLLGAALGVGAGVWLGRGMVTLYAEYFRFPGGRYILTPDVLATGVLVSLLTSVGGAAATVWRVMQLPPAEAMRPPAPTMYRTTALSLGPIAALFQTSGKMVLREIERKPFRLFLSSMGIAMAIAILIVGRFSSDAIEHLIETQFQYGMREDFEVTFSHALPERALREIAHLPGVGLAQGIRYVPARVRVGPRYRDALVVGHTKELVLRALVDGRGRLIDVPAEGALVTRKLAEILGVGIGDWITLEVQEDERPRVAVMVSALADEPYGLWVHMDNDVLHRLLNQQPRVSSVVLNHDSSQTRALRARLAELPKVASVARRQSIIDYFRSQSARSMTIMTVIMTVFAVVIAVGVVYNNARVALSMRAHDLATLRVLGFSRAEISAILLGELSVQILIAIPIGLGVGTWLSASMMANVDPERYRFEVIISPATYAFAVAVALVSGLVSALLVRNRLDRLDLIGVLKTRD